MSNSPHYYHTIQQASSAEFKDRGSKFIGYAFPATTIVEVKNYLLQIKKEHAKATHHCFAYRLGIDGNMFRVSDDGEPQGSAGKPILNQLLSKELYNVLVIVVRYYGGTMLGMPGLVNAYKTTASLALQMIPIVQMPVEIRYNLQFDYTKMNEIMMVIKQSNIRIVQQEIQLFCTMEIAIQKNNITETLFKLQQVIGLEIVAL